MNSQLKSLILMGVLGVGVIGLYNYINREEQIEVKVINSNNYNSTLTVEEREKLDGITSASVVPASFISKYTPHGFTNSSKKKALFVVGDNRDNSILFDMVYTAMKYFEENGIEVEMRDLYKMNFNPVLHPDEFYSQKDGIGATPEDVVIEQKLVTQADYIVFAYPNWHDTATSIVKGYQERVFGKKFAYIDTPNGPQGILKGKSIFTIMNCGYLGGGRGFIGDGVGIEDEKWDRYMEAYKVFDDDLANWWGMENLGRFVNDRYPRLSSTDYQKGLNELRDDLKNYLNKTFIDSQKTL